MVRVGRVDINHVRPIMTATLTLTLITRTSTLTLTLTLTLTVTVTVTLTLTLALTLTLTRVLLVTSELVLAYDVYPKVTPWRHPHPYP